jgi:hypothetical protein
MVTLASYKIYIDWDVSGKFDDAADKDISEVVTEMRWGRGRDTELDTSDVGIADVDIEDPDQDFVPENTGSPLFPNVVAGRQIKIQGLIDSGDTVQDNPLAQAAVTVNVTAGGNFTIGDYIKIEDEDLLISNIVGNALTVSRGELGTTDVAHVQNTVIYIAYNQFRGNLDDVLPRPSLDDQDGSLPCFDGLDMMARDKVSVDLHKAQTSDVIIADALDKISWPAGRRAIDTGLDPYPVVWSDRRGARNFVDDVAQSEFSLLYIDGRGYFAWENRHHRLAGAHLTSQWTCTDALMEDLEPMTSASQIRNVIIVDTIPYALTGLTIVLWLLSENKDNSPADSPLLQPGTTYTYYAKFPEVSDNLVAPVITTDYLGNLAQDGTGVDKSAQFTVNHTALSKGAIITVANNDVVAVYLTHLQIRGEQYIPLDAIEIEESDATSIGIYGQRDLPIHLTFHQNSLVIRDLALYVLATRKYPWPRYKVKLIGDTDATLEQILRRKISDRITVQAARFNINDDFYIDKIHHKVRVDGIHEAEWIVSDADSQMYWILGTSALGTTTKLGY